jgi:hypothetical protein
MNRVVITARGAGLFSDVYMVLGQLAEAERRGEQAVVYWNRTSLYWGDGGWRSARNVWEYVFEPVSDLRLSDLGMNPIACEGLNREELADRLYGRADVRSDYLTDHVGIPFVADTPAREETALRIFRRYVRVRPEVQALADDFWNTHFASASRVVGAHYRGTDKRAEVCLVPPAFYETALAPEIEAGATVFVATDDARVLSRLEARFPGRIVARAGVARSLDERPPHQNGTPRQAEDAVVDALLLARCARMLHGSSNLPGAVRLLAPDQPRRMLTIAG